MAQLGLQLLADAKETWESLKDIMGLVLQIVTLPVL